MLDPAAGTGSLITAAAARAQALGASTPLNVWGVELHQETFETLKQQCGDFGIPLSQLRRGDFFEASQGLGDFDAVLTNPPYVRHHELPDGSVKEMRTALGADGSAMDGRSSSWAYFVMRCMQLLRPGGRLGAILPGELLSANYGRRIVKKIGERFDRIIVVHCRGQLFGTLQLSTLAILGEGYAGAAKHQASVYGCSIKFDQRKPVLPRSTHLVPLRDAGEATAALFLGARETDIRLVRNAAQSDGFCRLDQIGSIAIGYVSGDKEFFHFTEAERNHASIRDIHLRRVVHRASHVQGMILQPEDWQYIRDGDKRCWLFYPVDEDEETVQRVITRGAESGVPARMKCRTRAPWWRVALGTVPEAVFVYLGKRPRIVENRARVYAANAFFTLTGRNFITTSLAVASLTSVFQLSALIAARRLGGGLRKLQVQDAAALPIPNVDMSTEIHDELDLLVRSGSWEEANRLADEVVLKGTLGWPSSEIENWQSRLKRLGS